MYFFTPERSRIRFLNDKKKEKEKKWNKKQRTRNARICGFFKLPRIAVAALLIDRAVRFIVARIRSADVRRWPRDGLTAVGRRALPAAALADPREGHAQHATVPRQ